MRTFADAWRVGAGQSLLDTSVVESIAPQTVSPGYQMTFPDTPGAIWTGGLGGAGSVEIVGRSAVLAGGSMADLRPGDLIDITDLNGPTGWATDAGGVIQAGDGGHPVSVRVAGAVPPFQLETTSDRYGGLLVPHRVTLITGRDGGRHLADDLVY